MMEPMMQPPPLIVMMEPPPPMVPVGPFHIPGAIPHMPPHAMIAEVLASVSRSPSPVPVRPVSPLPLADSVAEAEAAIRDFDDMFKRFTAVSSLPQMSQLHYDAHNNRHQQDFLQMRHNAHETYALRHQGHSAGVQCAGGHAHADYGMRTADYGSYGESMGKGPVGSDARESFGSDAGSGFDANRTQSKLSPAPKSSAYLRAQAAMQFLK